MISLQRVALVTKMEQQGITLQLLPCHPQRNPEGQRRRLLPWDGEVSSSLTVEG